MYLIQKDTNKHLTNVLILGISKIICILFRGWQNIFNNMCNKHFENRLTIKILRPKLCLNRDFALARETP